MISFFFGPFSYAEVISFTLDPSKSYYFNAYDYEGTLNSSSYTLEKTFLSGSINIDYQPGNLVAVSISGDVNSALGTYEVSSSGSYFVASSCYYDLNHYDTGVPCETGHDSIIFPEPSGPSCLSCFGELLISTIPTESDMAVFVREDYCSGCYPNVGSGYRLYVSEVSIPTAAWLFGSALIGLAGIKRKT
jgi:hypothetical protein